MKKIMIMAIFITFIVIGKVVANTNNSQDEFKDVQLAEEYNKYKDFDLKAIPERIFYKLNINCKYYLQNQNDTLQVIHNKEDGMLVYYNKEKLDLSDMESGFNYAGKDTNAYIIRNNGIFYLFIDHMHYNDAKYFHLYKLFDKKIETVLEDFGRIDFVGYDYIIGYTSLGIIGYQMCEFKKVFRNGKFELDGEYKISDKDGEYPSWKFYTLVKDLEYDEYNEKAKTYNTRVLKSGTRIRALATDGETYVNIETDKGSTGKLKIDRVDKEANSIYRDFIVKGELFMKSYFLDGSKYIDDVFCSIPSY